jgi:hypothetical protein
MGHWPKLGSYGKNRIFGPTTEILGPKKGILGDADLHFSATQEYMIVLVWVFHLCRECPWTGNFLRDKDEKLRLRQSYILVWQRNEDLRHRESLFLGPKFRLLVQKSDFCHTTPILVNDPFLALTMTVDFSQCVDFPFRSYSCFRKKIRLTAQKVFPPPTCRSSVCQ